MDDRVFIEEQFAVSNGSEKSYRKWKAGVSQTLTSLGKWWGRKLLMIRAGIIAWLMPVSSDPKRGRYGQRADDK